MNELQNLYNVRKNTLLWNMGLLALIFIIIFSGTYIRVRPMEESLEIDWLVIARLITCSIGLAIGVLLILKSHCRFRFGSIFLLLFFAATGVSAINSLYPIIVIGHVILLGGTIVLMIGMVYAASDVRTLEQIERVWFFTLAACVIKDTITSLIYPEAREGVIRLGMGITHANEISLLAGLIFWLSFRQKRSNIFIWVLRATMLLVIFGAISRVTIFSFLFGGFIFIYFFLRSNSFIFRWIWVLGCLSALAFFVLMFSFNSHWTNKALLYAKRGQSQAELVSFTGRTEVWKQAIRQISEAPLTGHGYSITYLTLNPITWDFKVAHCHNEFLEALFSTGVLGLIPLLLLYIYTLKWVLHFDQLKHIFSSDLTLHAVTVVVIFWVSTFFEPRVSMKMLPFQTLFFYYLLILDREKHFAIMGRENESPVTL